MGGEPGSLALYLVLIDPNVNINKMGTLDM